MKKYYILLSVLVFLATTALEAKPKKKTFNNSSEQVFAAALRTARERHVVSYVDAKQLLLTFQTGMSVWSYGFIANASVEPEGENKATLVLNVQNKKGLSMGAGDRMADKFFQQVQEELAGDVSQKSSIKPEAKAIDVPEPKAVPVEPAMTKSAATSAPTKVGTVLITCSTEGAEIYVDDAFVGNAPATLKLAAGKHALRVQATGKATWNREVSVLGDSETRLQVTLQ